jgi:drug/metabolite transporter (DMT)-like permease
MEMNWFGWATASALLSAAAAILQKRVLARVSPLEFSFLLSGVIVLCSLWIPWAADPGAVAPGTIGIIAARSLIAGVAFLLVMTALASGQISSVLPLLGLTPAVTAILSYFWTGEVLGGWEWLGIVLVIIGASILEAFPSPGRKGPTRPLSRRGHLAVGGAVLLFALSSILDKTLVSGYRVDPLVLLLYQHIVFVLLFGAILFGRGVSLRALREKGRSASLLLGGVAVLTLAYRFGQLEATRDAPVALVLAVKRTSILYASFIGGRLFSEDRLTAKLIAAALIVASGFLILRNVG